MSLLLDLDVGRRGNRLQAGLHVCGWLTSSTGLQAGNDESEVERMRLSGDRYWQSCAEAICERLASPCVSLRREDGSALGHAQGALGLGLLGE